MLDCMLDWRRFCKEVAAVAVDFAVGKVHLASHLAQIIAHPYEPQVVGHDIEEDHDDGVVVAVIQSHLRADRDGGRG